MQLEQIIKMILDKSSNQEQLIENIKTLIELEKYKSINTIYKQLPLNRHLDKMDLYDGEDGDWVTEIECYEASEVDRLLRDIDEVFLFHGYESLITSHELLLDNNLK